VRENAYHFVIGLVWLIVTVVALLVYIADGNALRRRKKDFQVINVLALNDAKELLTSMHSVGGAEGAGFQPEAIVSKEKSNVRFHSDQNLRPTEIQPPTIEQRTQAALARKPAPRAPLRRALRNVGTIALKGDMLGLIQIKNIGFLIVSSLRDKRISLAIALLITFLHWLRGRLGVAILQAGPLRSAGRSCSRCPLLDSKTAARSDVICSRGGSAEHRRILHWPRTNEARHYQSADD
jgi:hypothetical protein